MAGAEKRRGGIERMDYNPPGPYRLDLEIFTVSELRRRDDREKRRSTHRYSFHLLVCVARGTCTQLVDFKPVRCEAGSLLVLRPGQAHRFGFDEDWDGWLILFRPEFLPPAPSAGADLQLAVGIGRLPGHLSLSGEELRRVTGLVTRMREDAEMEAQPRDVHALLRYQLCALMVRLSIIHGRQEGRAGASAGALQRFQGFQQLVETNFVEWHGVAEYAKRLGCAEKSLTRATSEVMGMNAKAYIASRINLEAKRLLAHTDLSVGQIAYELGFEEGTNFIKFFKRETRCTPAEFRRQQNAPGAPFWRPT